MSARRLTSKNKTNKEEIVKRFELTRLPPYLILCIKRFTKNTFFVEKNPTIVNLPIKVTVMTWPGEPFKSLFILLITGPCSSVRPSFTRALLGLWISHRLLGGGGRLNAPPP